MPIALLPGDGIPCPFRALTGLPCPFCGGTRAVERAAHLDPSFLNYGAVWVLVIAMLLLAGAASLVLLAVAPERLRAVQATVRAVPERVQLSLLFGVIGVAWVWALAHTSTIVS